MCTVLLPPGDNPIAVNKYINITQREVVISYRRFGTLYRAHPQGSRIFPISINPVDGTDRLSRNVDKKLRLAAAYYPEERNSYVYCKFSLPDSLRPRCFERIICDSFRCCKDLEFLYSRCGICGGQGGTETWLSRSFSAVSYQHCFTNSALSYFIHLSWSLFNLSYC